MNNLKNNKIILVSGVVIGVIIFGLIVFLESSNDSIQKNELIDKPLIMANYTSTIPDLSNKTAEEINQIIEEKYENILNNKSPYEPLPRVWQSSGPFKIDREKYVLGEKIFFIADGIKNDEKGKIILYRPINSTHAVHWSEFPFDGSIKSAFNIYFQPQLSEIRNICNTSDLVGVWTVIFQGTQYPDINFEILDKILPGDEAYFQDKC